jgi:signal transduction histidine kinase
MSSPWSALLEALGVPVFVKDRALLFTDCNTLLSMQVLGVDRALLLGRSASDVMGAKAGGPHEDHDRALLADADAGGRAPQIYERPIRYADGTRGHARFIKAPLCDPETDAVTGLVGMIVDLTADHERAAVLSRSASRNEQANAEKDRFLVNMSHQLRTPLNNVIGYAEALSMGVFGALNEAQREYAESIVKAGRHMESVFAVVLDVARQTEPGHREGEVWIDLHAVCRDMIQAALPRATAASVTLGLHADTALNDRPLRVDEAAMRHIVDNLIRNAIAFTAPGGRVDLSTALERGRVLIRVIDSGGSGAMADRVRRILEPLPHAGDGSSTGSPATTAGVGLTVVKTLVAALGGVFELNSVPGRGTTATVRLPASRLGPAKETE